MPHTQSQEGLQQEVIVQSTTTSSDHVYIPGVPSWIATLLTVVGLIIAAVALSLAVSGQPVTAPAPEPTPALEVPPPPPAAQPAVGPLMAGADPILPLPAEGLAPYAGRTVHGNAVPVQSVVADEGFWVGTSETDRVYVIYRTGGGESPPDVDAGQLVNFVGSLQPATAEVDAPQFRLTEAEGLGQLRSQGYFVGVPSVDVVVDGPEGGVGPLMAGADPILPLPAEGLAPYAGRTVHGNAVPVQSVVADEGFWVGTSETDRVYVIYRTGGGESPPDVDAGQLVNFVGSLQPATAEVDAPQFRLTEAEGLGQLRSQGYFVGVPSVDVVVDGPEQPD